MAADEYHTISDAELGTLCSKARKLDDLTWKSVEAETPPKMGEYLVLLDTTLICTAFFDSSRKWREMNGSRELEVCYWMYLPEHPMHQAHRRQEG